MAQPRTEAASKPAVLTKALCRASGLLGLTQQELAAILHVSPATASRWMNGRSELTPEAADGQLALLFLRVFRSLDTLVGGSSAKAGEWLRAKNAHLGAVPLERLKAPEGLVHVAEYLDALRGKA